MQRLIFIALSLSFALNLPGQPLTAERIQALADRYGKTSLSQYREFLSLPNDAYQPEQLEANIEWVQQAFSFRGFDLRRLPTGGIDLVLASYPAPGATRTVLFYVQIDGQPVDPTEWDQPTPFTPTLKAKNDAGEWEAVSWARLKGELNPDWRIFARSAADAKGPINMFIAAWDAMQEAGLTPNYNLKIIMDCEEEIGSPHLPAAVEKYRNELAADMLVILDGPMHPTNRPTLVFGARGIAKVRLTTYGPRVPQHSGHYGNYVPNPAFRLAQLLASMKDAEGRVTVAGWYDGVNIDEATRRVLAEVPDDEAAIQKHLGIAEPEAVAPTLQEAIQYPSLNIQGMSSAWVGTKVRTIIPSAAMAHLDIRLVRESDPERLIRLLREHVEAQGYHLLEKEPTEAERLQYPRLVSMSSRVSYQAFRTDMDAEVGRWLEAALRRTFGEAPVKIRTHGGSIPIAPFVTTLDVPAVIVPLVNPDNNQHSPNENLRIGNYFDGVRSCLGILTQPLD